MTRLTLSAQFRPWLACASAKNGRPLLEGVFFDPVGYAVAADTHILAACPFAVEGAVSGFPGVIVPGEFLKTVYK
ncbi:MAG TPA: hypothetical protein VGP44_08275, partial [Gemmatimonadales bacterium]|nr:hypothetical protein [Gemmatimonadales bacterium]